MSLNRSEPIDLNLLKDGYFRMRKVHPLTGICTDKQRSMCLGRNNLSYYVHAISENTEDTVSLCRLVRAPTAVLSDWYQNLIC